ncbi:MAG: sodium-dependent transporter, partial [Candidatus Binatia bacterium]|nr:sodium-dependent transporter [Candidatus Binatia bacterium]
MAGQESENFTSRWTMLLSMIGVAVGTGNIWRFPRIAAKYGGGSFLILWKGTVGAFARLVGPHYAWMGACVGFVTTAIMFYYSVVNGWCLWYLLAALTGNLQGLGVAEAQTLWSNVIHGAQPVLFHLLSMGIGTVILSRNVVRGIERANRLFVPSLVVLMAVLLLRAVTLPGALKGIESFLTVRWEMFFDYRPWLDALSQNAWSMSASWGLILTYVVYLRKREDTVLNPVITAFANHS